MTSLNTIKKHNPLIERCIIIGTDQKDINSQNITYNNILNGNIEKMPIKILENFKSNFHNEENSEIYEKFIKGLIHFCYLDNFEIKLGHNIKEYKIISFILQCGNDRKFISSLMFYENYILNSIYFSLPKIICLISNYEILDTSKQILINVYHIFFPKKKEQKFYFFKSLNSKNEKSQYFIIQDNQIMEFYMSFVLNILPYEEKYNNILVNGLNNNFGEKTFLTYHIESQNLIPLKDFNLFILFENFKIEDLLNIYIGMLIGYKIIIIFENYEEINQILLSLTSIIYPLNWKKFPLISFITNDMTEIFDSPISMIMGVHVKYLNILKEKISIGEIENDTIIYNIIDKNNIFSNLKNIDLTLETKSSMNKEINEIIYERSILFDKDSRNEYYNLFGDIIFLIDSKKYFNLKISYIFFKYFLEIIQNIDFCIKKYDRKNNKKGKKSKILINNYFDFQKFSNDERCKKYPKFKQFMIVFSNSMIFNEFLFKYIFSQDNIKYSSISNYIKIIKDNPLNFRMILSQKFISNIKKQVISSYNFTIISMNKVFETYYNLLEPLIINKENKKSNYIIWNPLEIYKVMIKYNSITDYFIQKPKDEKYETIKKELNKISTDENLDSDDEAQGIHELNSQCQLIFDFFKNKEYTPSKYVKKNKKSSCPNLPESQSKEYKKNNITARNSSCLNLDGSIIDNSTLSQTIKSKKSKKLNKRVQTHFNSYYIQKLNGDENKTIFSDDDSIL